MTRVTLCAALLAGLLAHPVSANLRVSPDGRGLVTADQEPFIWIGDTAWNLFVHLDRTEAERYLQDRRQKKFTVIQANIVGLRADAPNAYGETALVDQDFGKPNEKYFQHVDWVVQRAGELGLHMMLLPAWARSNVERDPILVSADTAYRYGRFLGRRYADATHIIWSLGGDARPTKHDIYDALARGIEEGLGHDPLMTYHPPGGTYRPPATSTGEFYHDKPWLDFNQMQSGHRRGNQNYLRIAEDYARTPIKPTLDSEPCYENHPIEHKMANGVFGAWDVRQRAYWSVLAGAFGFSYGGNGVWQMDKPGRVFKDTHHTHFWYDALDHGGAAQLRHLHAFLQAYPHRIPDQSILATDAGAKETRLQAARTPGGKWLIYSTNGRSFEVELPAESGSAEWLNPRDGSRRPGEWTAAQDPPGEPGDGNDWLLILE